MMRFLPDCPSLSSKVGGPASPYDEDRAGTGQRKKKPRIKEVLDWFVFANHLTQVQLKLRNRSSGF